jgi:hypothetical protein
VAEHSNYQKKVIQRYYDNIDTIALQKLGELVSELYMETSEKKAEKLWQRVAASMSALKIPDKIAQHILSSQDVEILARNLQDWLRGVPK